MFIFGIESNSKWRIKAAVGSCSILQEARTCLLRLHQFSTSFWFPKRGTEEAYVSDFYKTCNMYKTIIQIVISESNRQLLTAMTLMNVQHEAVYIKFCICLLIRKLQQSQKVSRSESNNLFGPGEHSQKMFVDHPM